MSVAQPNLPGSGTTLRILRDDGVTFVGITVPSEMLWPGPVGAKLAQSPGLSAAEQARARGVALTPTRQPREPSMEGPGWAIYTFPGTQQLYVLRDDGTHLSWGGGAGLFTPARAAGVISATPGLSATEIARLSSILGGAVAGGGTPTPTPSFTAQPSISPSSGPSGTLFTATPGTVSNGTISSRAWLLNGSSISTGLTATPVSDGTLTYQEFATGAGGNASSAVQSVTVAAAAANLKVPSNYDAVFFGNSITEYGVNSNPSQTSGYNHQTQNCGVGGWWGAETGHRSRVALYANFGISASNTAQMILNPRPNSTGTVTAGRWDRPGPETTNFSSNKGTSDVAAHPAGIVVMHAVEINDASTANSEANIATIMDQIGTGKLIILTTGTARGILPDGTAAQGVANGSDRYALSRQMLKYSYNSGDPKARPNVLVVDTFAESVDLSTAPNYTNKRGYKFDGLHDSPFASRLYARLIHQALSAALGVTYTGQPARITAPTGNALSPNTQANAAPFVNSNPTLTAGTDGAVAGTFATAPLASGIPQGWAFSSAANTTGMTVVAEKGLTDPNGKPMVKFTIGGTLATAITATLNFRQQISSATLNTLISGGFFSVNDKLRGRANVRVDAGSQKLIGVGISATYADAASGRAHVAGGTNALLLSTETALNNVVDTFGNSDWATLITEVMDLQDPNVVAQNQNAVTPSLIEFNTPITFRNLSGSTANVSAVIYISEAGIYRSANG